MNRGIKFYNSALHYSAVHSNVLHNTASKVSLGSTVQYSPETVCLHLQLAVQTVQWNWICRLGRYFMGGTNKPALTHGLLVSLLMFLALKLKLLTHSN